MYHRRCLYQAFTKLICLFFIYNISGICSAQDAVPVTQSDQNLHGYVVFQTLADSFYVVIDEDFDNPMHLATRDTMKVRSGVRSFRFVKKYHNDIFIRRYTVIPDSVDPVRFRLVPFSNIDNNKLNSSYPRIAWNAPVVIKGEKDAEIYVNGEFAGKGMARVNEGNDFNVTTILPSGSSVSGRYQIDTKRELFTVVEHYNRPVKAISYSLSAIPGASQIYKREKLKGSLIFGAFAIGTGISYFYHREYQDQYEKFENARLSYNNANSPEAAFTFGNLAEQHLQNSNSAAKTRNLLIYGTIGLYLYNVIDALRTPASGYQRRIYIDPYIDFNHSSIGGGGISAKYNF